MRLMCVDNKSLEEGYIPPLTIGKIYDEIISNDEVSVWVDDVNYYILNDAGFGSWELIENFIPLEEARDKKLKELGIWVLN